MSKIYSFLQKIKLRESSHGMYMVIVAYILSSLLLIFGSDTFYNIGSKAEGVSNYSEEETQIISQEKIMNNYGTANYAQAETDKAQSNKGLEEKAVSGDTNWLFGYAMDTGEYNNLLELMHKTCELQAKIKGIDISGSSTEPTQTAITAVNAPAAEKKAEALSNESNTNTAKTNENSAKKETEKVKSKTVESYSVINETYSTVLPITQQDVKMLERIVEAEATGEDMVGKILVANVVLNRIADDEFPDTVKEVIFQKVNGKYQFSPISDKRYWSVEVTNETKKAVKRALKGEDYSEGALYFMARKHTRKKLVKWFDNNLEWLFKHGGHEFYKNK